MTEERLGRNVESIVLKRMSNAVCGRTLLRSLVMWLLPGHGDTFVLHILQ